MTFHIEEHRSVVKCPDAVLHPFNLILQLNELFSLFGEYFDELCSDWLVSSETDHIEATSQNKPRQEKNKMSLCALPSYDLVSYASYLELASS